MAFGGSPLTVARPCRIFTGFPRASPDTLYRNTGAGPLRGQRWRMPPPAIVQLAAFLTFVALLASGAGTAAASPRIGSLVPSLTEDLFAIGAGSQVVGVSQFTDYPPAARRLPVVGSASSVDAERILKLHPDAVVGISAQAMLVADVRRLGLRVELMPDDSFADLFDDLALLGKISGRQHQARELAARLRARTSALERTVPALRRDQRPRCFVVFGVAPIYTAGDRSYIAHLIELAGGRNAATALPVAYGQFSEEALLALQPDVIVADRPSGLQSVLGRAPWNGLRAVQQGRVYVLNDPAILERPGPRYNEGLAWLIARSHQRGS